MVVGWLGGDDNRPNPQGKNFFGIFLKSSLTRERMMSHTPESFGHGHSL